MKVQEKRNMSLLDLGGEREASHGCELAHPRLVRLELPARGEAVLQEGEVHTASTDGADEHTLFELASLSKPMTGMLLLDAVGRGEVGLEDTLAEHLLELEGTEAGEITLEELVQDSNDERLYWRYIRSWLIGFSKPLDNQNAATLMQKGQVYFDAMQSISQVHIQDGMFLKRKVHSDLNTYTAVLWYNSCAEYFLPSAKHKACR